jgi:hypothetical protein
MRKKTLLTALCVLVLLCLAYRELVILGAGNEGDDVQGDLLEINSNTGIVSVYVEPSGGEYAPHSAGAPFAKHSPYQFSVDANGRGRVIAVDGYDGRFAFDTAAFGRLMGTIETMKAYKAISGDPENFGISKSSPRVKVTFNDGKMMTLVFGDITPANADRVYVKVEENRKIYVVRKTTAELCTRSVYAYRTPQLMAEFFKGTESGIPERIKINGEGTVLIRPRTKEERAKTFSRTDAPSVYVMEKPRNWACADGKVYSIIMEPILRYEANAFVVEDFPSDRKKYGLDAGLSLTVESSGKRCKITFGGEKDGYVYAMREDIPSVLAVKRDAVKIMDADWFDFADTSIVMRSIDKIDAFMVKTEDVLYSVKLLRNELGALTGASVNNVGISEEKTRELYSDLLNVHLCGAVSEDESPKTSPFATVTLRHRDGRYEQTEFTEFQKDTCIVSQNGEPIGFYADRSGLDKLTEALASAERDG